MKTHDCIYAAGFVDGAGCITTSGTSGFRVTITSTDREFLNWMKSKFGGNINDQHRPENPRWNASWKWIVSSKPDVACFLKAVYPYLKIKKKQAKIVLDYLEKYPANTRGRRVSVEQLESYESANTLLDKLKYSKRNL